MSTYSIYFSATLTAICWFVLIFFGVRAIFVKYNNSELRIEYILPFIVKIKEYQLNAFYKKHEELKALINIAESNYWTAYADVYQYITEEEKAEIRLREKIRFSTPEEREIIYKNLQVIKNKKDLHYPEVLIELKSARKDCYKVLAYAANNLIDKEKKFWIKTIDGININNYTTILDRWYNKYCRYESTGEWFIHPWSWE